MTIFSLEIAKKTIRRADVQPAGCSSPPSCSWTPCLPCAPGTYRTGRCSGPRPSLERLADYLSHTAGYDDIRLTVFPHGADSAGLATIGEWQAVLGDASRHGQLIAVDPDRYPRHFRALSGFHRELVGCPGCQLCPRSAGTTPGSTWLPTRQPAM